MNYFITLALFLLFYMTFWFIVSIFKKRNDIADIAWGIGFVLMTWLSLFLSGNLGVKSIVVGSLVTIWGFRLALHIYFRNRGKTEDYRYLAWRKEWGNFFYVRSYFQVYILQGIFLFLILLPVLILNKDSTQSISIFSIVGVFVWITGFFFESVGDSQLSKFISNPENKGKIMQSGLWKYTRHPNYFGEVTQWWGIWIISLGAMGSLWGLIGPLTITILILKVSGIPMLENKMKENIEFSEYKKKN